MADILFVQSLRGLKTVPYYADMQIYEYLQRVLMPILEGPTIPYLYTYTRPDGLMVAFDRNTRLERLGDLVPPGETLYSTFEPTDESLRGNAVRWDVTAECAICLDADTDYELRGCGHRFHAFCLSSEFYHRSRGMDLLCPLCREQVHPDDEWGPWEAITLVVSKVEVGL